MAMKRKLASSNKVDLNPNPSKLARLDAKNPIIITRNDAFQKLLGRKHIPFGIQFELARLIASDPGSLDRYRQNISALSEAQLPRTHVELVSRLFETSVLRSHEEDASSSPWSELDKESSAFTKDPHFAGIGNNPDFPGWWAGNVDFRARLEETGDRIMLEKPSLGPSNKIQRRFGSQSVLRVKVHSKFFYARQNNLVAYFKRPLVIWGYVFRAFFSKDNTVFFFQTNEEAKDGCIMESPCSSRLSLFGLVQWINPLELNGNQKLCKWASRMALGLSSSIPGARLRREDIKWVSDIILNEDDPSTNMTDGCGQSVLSLNKELFETYRGKYLDCIPTAFQFRFAGAKGMLLLDDRTSDSSSDDEHKITLRSPSQIKIRYPGFTVPAVPSPLDPSHLTIDILRFSRTKTPAKLSAETIQNLHENGVPASVFTSFLETRLRELVEGLTTWEGHDAIPNLWKAVEGAEGVVSARKARQSATDGRIQGFRDVNEEDEDEETLSQDKSPTSSAWWRDPFSGCPSSIAETIMELLDSGFTPSNSPYLRDKLKQLVKKKVAHAASKFNYIVSQSASAFVVPDPHNVLKQDEIQFKCSRRDFMLGDGTRTDIILGDVLMTRNPCKVPTDVRKLQAVQHPSLSNLVDVIVCSVQGHRRLLDFLAGGDYDGDRAMVIWDNLFVQSFNNAPERYSKTPPGIEYAFSVDQKTVSQFCEGRVTQLGGTVHESVVEELQEYLLGSLVDPSYVGEYSRFHENAIYKFGYSHSKTVKLAYQFCIILDAAKTGHRIKPASYQNDRKNFAHPIGPPYKMHLDKMQKISKGQKNDFSLKSNELPLKRSSGKETQPFILDILVTEAARLRDLYLQKVEEHFGHSSLGTRPDGTLTAPWTHFNNKAIQQQDDRILRDLQLISKHVEEMFELRRASYHASELYFTSQHITQRQDTIRDLSKRFVAYPEAQDMETLMEDRTIARLRASYAYIYASRNAGGNSSSQFPFDRAFRELCAIKAESNGLYKVCTLDMYERRR